MYNSFDPQVKMNTTVTVPKRGDLVYLLFNVPTYVSKLN